MIADVAVPIAGVDGALSYAIPRALEEKVARGVRVLVPVSGRRLVGLVVALRADKIEREVKPILEVLDDAAIVDENQIALIEFVSHYYAADIGSCARLVMPPDTERVVERRFRLTERGEQARVLSSDLTKHDVALLERFGAGEVVREKRVAFTKSQRTRLEQLVARGYVENVGDERAAGAVRVDEVLHVVAESDANAKPLPKNAPALAAFDAWLRALAPHTPTVVDAAVAHTNARGKAKKLAALGRVRIEARPHASVTHASTSSEQHTEKVLNEGQANALAKIETAIAHNNATAFLLEGITGSGKTEVYLRAVKAVLARKQSAILIVPEIGLTPQLVARVRQALAAEAGDVVVLHSGVSAPERRDGLARLRAGLARVVVGARSALFAPVRDLGLVVVDEEHDASLKQDETPRYHARDVALWRAKNEGAVCILGSATPSLETRHNVALGKIELLELPVRATGAALPKVDVIDLRARAGVAEAKKRDRMNADEGPGVVLAGPLVEAMAETLAKKQQVLLFLNKRGYWSALLCEMCGHIEQCPNCSVTLTLHRRRNALLCHQCDHEHAVPKACPECANEALVALGLGTERLETEVRARFPDANVARLDRDSTQRKGELERVLSAIQAREVDVVVGTQMIAKGHDFPGVTLVGVVLADIALAMPDFRAQERAFALLAQVAGRAGRAGEPGRVLVQTFKPESPAVQFAVEHDVRGFAQVELAERELHKYPPFVRAVLFRVEHEDATVAATLAADVKSAVDLAAAEAKVPRAQWSALGPAPCALERAHGRTRWQVFVRTRSVVHRSAIVDAVRRSDALKRAIGRQKARFVVDVDPVHLL